MVKGGAADLYLQSQGTRHMASSPSIPKHPYANLPRCQLVACSWVAEQVNADIYKVM